MEIVQKLGGFSLGEADNFKKGDGKEKNERNVERKKAIYRRRS